MEIRKPQDLPIAAKLLAAKLGNTYGAGYTFKYNEQGQLVSLMTDKKYIVLNARGGDYSSPEMNAMEMAVNYINKVVGGVFGMQKQDEVIIEGHASSQVDADQIIAEGLEKVKAAAQKLATVTA